MRVRNLINFYTISFPYFIFYLILSWTWIFIFNYILAFFYFRFETRFPTILNSNYFWVIIPWSWRRKFNRFKSSFICNKRIFYLWTKLYLVYFLKLGFYLIIAWSRSISIYLPHSFFFRNKWSITFFIEILLTLPFK